MHARIRLAAYALTWTFCSAVHAAWQPLPARPDDRATSPEVRNVILLIPQGCSQSLVTLARWTRGRPLALDQIQTGAVKTHSASSLVTDSAAAATAMACGVKTANGLLGVAPPQEAALRPADLPYGPDQPLATVLEGAKQSGRAAGLVVTGNLWDATPAGFSAHTLACKSGEEPLKQMLYQDLDVVFGGGQQRFRPAAAGGTRTDGSNLAAEIDRAALAPEQPSLAQMTAQAIHLLQPNRRGFFLLVVGSQVNKADHANDPATAVQAFLAFDDAVAEVLQFATGAGAGQTLVIACPDHDTGGLSIGQRNLTPQTVADLTAPLIGMQVSAENLAAKIGSDRSAANIMAHVAAWWNIRLAPATADEITNSIASGLSLENTLGAAVSRHHTAIGWTSFDPTGVDVPLWSFGPGRPTGLIDNTEVARAIARALRLDLPALTRALYVDARQPFPAAKIDRSDPATPALVIGAARLPVNQNLLFLNGKTHQLNGVVVHIEKTGHTYLPQQAVNLIRATGQ